MSQTSIQQTAEPERDALSQLPPDRDGRDGLLHGQMLSGGFSFSTAGAGALVVVTVKSRGYPIQSAVTSESSPSRVPERPNHTAIVVGT